MNVNYLKGLFPSKINNSDEIKSYSFKTEVVFTKLTKITE